MARRESPARILIVAHQTADSPELLAAVAGRAADRGSRGSRDPLAAVQDALNLLGFYEVILSMLPARLSRWLRLDLPHKIRGLGVPATEVVGGERAATPLPAA